MQERDKNEVFLTHDTENLSLHLTSSMVQLPLGLFEHGFNSLDGFYCHTGLSWKPAAGLVLWGNV